MNKKEMCHRTRAHIHTHTRETLVAAEKLCCGGEQLSVGGGGDDGEAKCAHSFTILFMRTRTFLGGYIVGRRRLLQRITRCCRQCLISTVRFDSGGELT